MKKLQYTITGILTLVILEAAPASALTLNQLSGENCQTCLESVPTTYSDPTCHQLLKQQSTFIDTNVGNLFWDSNPQHNEKGCFPLSARIQALTVFCEVKTEQSGFPASNCVTAARFLNGQCNADPAPYTQGIFPEVQVICGHN